MNAEKKLEMDESREEKLLAVARHIAKTLGRTDTMTDDILQVFSSFDGRFSLDKLLSDTGRLEPSSFPAAAADGRRFPPIPSIERTIRSLDRQISRFVASDRLIWSDSADASAFLEAVDDLLATIHDLDPLSSAAATPSFKPLLDRADDLLRRCMLRLEKEFRAIIQHDNGVAAAPLPGPSSPSDSDAGEDMDGEEQVPVAHRVQTYNVVIDALPPGSLAALHEIARRMVNAGFGHVCTETYALARREFVHESVARLGLRPRSADEVHSMPWEEIEDEILLEIIKTWR